MPWCSVVVAQVVSHAQVLKASRYYTMSAAGITHFYDGQTEFISLAQWEREYLFHMRLTKLRVFRHFKLWKSVAIWRKVVWERKTTASTSALEKGLFVLNPAFRQALFTIRYGNKCI